MMDRIGLIAFTVAALAAGPMAALAAESNSVDARSEASGRADASASRYDLGPSLPRPIRAASGQPADQSAGGDRRSATRDAARFASRTTIDGPALSYRTSRRGPVFEVAALGGGAMADAPFLAHLGMNWRF